MPIVTERFWPGTIVAHPAAINPPTVTGDPDTAWSDGSTATSATSHTDAGLSATATAPAAVIDFSTIPAGATVTAAVLTTRMAVIKNGGSNYVTTVLSLWRGDNMVDNAEVAFDPNTLSNTKAYWAEGLKEIPRDVLYWWPEFGSSMGVGYFGESYGPSNQITAQDSVIYDVWLDVTYDAPAEQPVTRQYPRDDDRGLAGVRRGYPRPRSARGYGGHR